MKSLSHVQLLVTPWIAAYQAPPSMGFSRQEYWSGVPLPSPPRDSILYQTASRLPVANRVFLGSWTVDIHQEGHSQRSAPKRRHTAHLRRHSCCAPRKPSGWDMGGDKTHCPTWGVCVHQAPGRLSCSDLGRAQHAAPTESVPLWSTQELEPE